MTQWKQRGLSVLLALTLLLGLSVSAFAAESDALSAAQEDTAKYLTQTVRKPQVGSIGGEWAVLGLSRSGYTVPEGYFRDYYAAVEDYVSAKQGVLHEKKYTEYSRLIVALSSIGKDARNVAGYDLTAPLGDYDKTVWQGINGPIWALIALDSRNYPMPVNTAANTQATRQMYVDRILDSQRPDGGWSLTANDAKSDPDLTGMALQALAKYRDQARVQQAVDAALEWMSAAQGADGGFSSWDTANSESCAQMIVALCELGIPLDDARFVKNGNTLLDNLLTFYRPGAGFLHTQDGGGSNQMATEQAFYALTAARRAAQGKNSLYRMGDAADVTGSGAAGNAEGLPGKNSDVRALAAVAPGKTFPDVSAAHENRAAIEGLAALGVVGGKTGGGFDPEANLTRAEFATIVVNALGLTPKANDHFTDVKAGDWFAPYVGTAYAYGIVSGTGETTFEPNGTITRQEAAVMTAQAARLCGMDTALDTAAVRDVLAQFGDYITADSWARTGLAFCYDNGILDDSDLNIRPKTAVKRCEMAQMIWNLLGSAELR